MAVQWSFIGQPKIRNLLIYGEPAGARTRDPRLKRAMLYQLSYRLTERKARILPPTLSLCLARTSWTSPVYLVYSVCLVCLVERTNQMNQTD